MIVLNISFNKYLIKQELKTEHVQGQYRYTEDSIKFLADSD